MAGQPGIRDRGAVGVSTVYSFPRQPWPGLRGPATSDLDEHVVVTAARATSPRT